MKIYTNKTKLKGLDIPLTDSEIKKLLLPFPFFFLVLQVF
jgi:hypothetical protein